MGGGQSLVALTQPDPPGPRVIGGSTGRTTGTGPARATTIPDRFVGYPAVEVIAIARAGTSLRQAERLDRLVHGSAVSASTQALNSSVVFTLFQVIAGSS